MFDELYRLSWIDEGNTEREFHFTASNDHEALTLAQRYVAGNEGLWSGIELSDGINELEPADGWF